MTTEIISIITAVITFTLGLIAKKVKWINNNLIPVQNLAIGIVFAVVDFIITKDFKAAIAFSGLFAGGTYDIFHNLSKMIER